MTSRLSLQDQELLRITSEVLHYLWDPIGVAGIPQARDEYDEYVGPVLTLLRSGGSDTDISAHLEQIVADRMGLRSCKDRSDGAAAVLAGWRDYLAEVAA